MCKPPFSYPAKGVCQPRKEVCPKVEFVKTPSEAKPEGLSTDSSNIFQVEFECRKSSRLSKKKRDED